MNNDSTREPEEFTDEEAEEAAQHALGEVLNLAAQMAELQLDEQMRAEIYELLDAVADYYGVERTLVELAEDGSVTVTEYNGSEEEDEGPPPGTALH